MSVQKIAKAENTKGFEVIAFNDKIKKQFPRHSMVQRKVDLGRYGEVIGYMGSAGSYGKYTNVAVNGIVYEEGVPKWMMQNHQGIWPISEIVAVPQQ